MSAKAKTPAGSTELTKRQLKALDKIERTMDAQENEGISFWCITTVDDALSMARMLLGVVKDIERVVGRTV